MATTYGWDASNHDDPPGARDGIDLYTHKAGEGLRFYYDREYRQSISNARDLGIPVLGAYFVNHPGDQNAQADWFVALLDQDSPWWREHPCFVLQIDAEKFDYMSRAPTPAEIQTFGNRLVQAHGVDPRRVLAYAPRWLYGDTLTGLTFRLWASDYGGNPVGWYRDVYPGNQDAKRWRAYSGQVPLILQYGSNTNIAGQTTCDANAFRGTLAELMQTLGAGAPPGPPEPPEGEDDMIGFIMQDPDNAQFAIWADVESTTGWAWVHLNGPQSAGLQRGGWKVVGSDGDPDWRPGIFAPVPAAEMRAAMIEAIAQRTAQIVGSDGGGPPVLIDHSHDVPAGRTGGAMGD